MFIKQFISWERKKAKSLLCYNRFCTSFSEKLRIIILEYFGFRITSVSSVAQLCPTLCDPMNHSTPGLPVHHHLLEFTQTHVHRVGDAIQPSHPLSSPFPPAPNPSQHQDYLVQLSIIDYAILVIIQSLSRVTLCNPMACSPPASSGCGISQARTLEWVAVS